jgi:arginine N-succinyltransferase
MAQFPERFEKEIIAELRGVVHGDGRSPLWEALGAHFFEMGFPRAETLTSESKRFIADLMPRHPIYIPLLPLEAQEAIGQVHRNTRPALALLQQEGFEFRDIVDIFDGGPAVHARVEDVRVIRENSATEVVKIEPSVSNGRKMIVANARLEFRCCLGDAFCQGRDATIDQVTALRLNVKVGDSLRLVDIKPGHNAETN